MTRECGECQLCCEIFAVEILSKNHLEKCQHQCETGCAIHTEKPRECKRYQCLWRSDESISEDNRPDKLGIVIDKRNTPLGPAIAIHQKEANQWQQPTIWPILQLICKEYNCWLYAVHGLNRQTIFPPWSVEAQKRFDDMMEDGKIQELLGELSHPDK